MNISEPKGVGIAATVDVQTLGSERQLLDAAFSVRVCRSYGRQLPTRLREGDVGWLCGYLAAGATRVSATWSTTLAAIRDALRDAESGSPFVRSFHKRTAYYRDLSVEGSRDPFFSKTPCELCGTPLGGDRYRARAYDEDDRLTDLEACQDCVQFIVYDQEPEEWEGPIDEV